MAEGLTNSIKAAREARGWTQADLAERVGVTRKTVNTVENNVFVPSTIVALKIARAFGVSVEELFALPDET
jgi:putative transcriptional regulator